jgi:hypothetical protein
MPASLYPVSFAGHRLHSGFLTSASETGPSIINKMTEVSRINKLMEVSKHKSAVTFGGRIGFANMQGQRFYAREDSAPRRA